MPTRRPPILRLSLGLAVAALGLATTGCGRDARPEAELAPARFDRIGVNAWLWRAALATLKFMPLATVDSAGGVIVTDWFQNPEDPSERVKVSVVILDAELRADALQVSVTRQVRQEGEWVQAPVRAGTVQRLEEAILERARNLRQAALGSR
ncbi:MAG: DUF3576 domain-containing protein [Sphingomonadaceae bacterium]|uniref:DUF3576 domain-containing protein n=1 Tax=Thermaurantiacus sp. TaxID=2820283 RepID=UPI00298EF9E1|nr:DUF3576 domain-containing protein [Thermaurantiacus sp.]MCS6987518.1 DUF3576 domain-containing protein [Sphingomonadaceae bacterium]MDW8415119.1 DUF3576 domain-containing protein [Thermaurantiacus sp.]